MVSLIVPAFPLAPYTLNFFHHELPCFFFFFEMFLQSLFLFSLPQRL